MIFWRCFNLLSALLLGTRKHPSTAAICFERVLTAFRPSGYSGVLSHIAVTQAFVAVVSLAAELFEALAEKQ